jgi:integrase
LARVFTREDGSGLRPDHVSDRFQRLVMAAGLPPVRLHDLRHGSATMLLTARVPMKVVSEILGHASSAFTADVYTSVSEDLAEAAADELPRSSPARHAPWVTRDARMCYVNLRYPGDVG